eukprot:TRINITY_DN13618_c0_g1_i1.p2 TRINITY_DN13618_c0_g1~~TRINITY_DN13618_c0_g1_i1.p2  ORF type:complete len:157 (+),score=50.11 TRINITY_DN13618_c0_g1_i1:74-544(+)
MCIRDRGVELPGLWDEITTVMESVGFKTSKEEDVLALAGIELCGVGVRRPEVYVKRGNGSSDPFITLRHPEWGHTRAFNMVLHSWGRDRQLLADLPDPQHSTQHTDLHSTQHTQHTDPQHTQHTDPPTLCELAEMPDDPPMQHGVQHSTQHGLMEI